MNSSVLLDTCFLISLVDDTRENHEKAVAFYKYFLQENIAMILSSIVTCEFCVKQPIEDLPLKNFKPLSFNIPDSYHLSKIFFDKFKVAPKLDRISIKDDYKIISQCSFNKLTYLITEDKPMFDMLVNLKNEQRISFVPLFTPNGYEFSFNIHPTLF